MRLLETNSNGLYCAAGDFYVDPWRPVPRAVVTHAHSDHARAGCGAYLVAKEGEALFQLRLGADANIESLDYGQTVNMRGVRISLHPAGHMTGAAQIRLELNGQVWVVTGDYKLQADPTCQPFEPVRCHTLITESTFGLPIFRWPSPAVVFAEINQWWRENQLQKKATVLYGYTIGKAQRLLSGIDASIGPIIGHGAIVNACRAYAACGVKLPEVNLVSEIDASVDRSQALVIAPPSAHGTPWLRRFGTLATGMASGWMQVRGIRRRRALDRGFLLSDHVDWPDLLTAIKASEASEILVTHGYVDPVVRFLRSQGWQASPLATQFAGEEDRDALDAPLEEDASPSQVPLP